MVSDLVLHLVLFIIQAEVTLPSNMVMWCSCEHLGWRETWKVTYLALIITSGLL